MTADFEIKLKSILGQIGLSDLQSNFYIYLLVNGETKVSTIAKKLKVNRTNSYAIVQKLKGLDMVIERDMASGKLLSANNYKPILQAIKNKEAELTQHEQNLSELIPMFESLNTSSQNIPQGNIYTRLNDLDHIFEDILNNNSKKQLKIISRSTSSKALLSKPKYSKFLKELKLKRIDIDYIIITEEADRKIVKVDEKTNPFNSDQITLLYSDKIVHISAKDQFSIALIQSTEIAEFQKQIFEFIYDIG